jgi:hypothetical protein
MGLFQDELTPSLAEWMLKQQMFWVASAPLSADGHVNISPKGVEGTFHVDSTRRVWYEDLSGTGIIFRFAILYRKLILSIRRRNCGTHQGKWPHYNFISCIRGSRSDRKAVRKRLDRSYACFENHPYPNRIRQALFTRLAVPNMRHSCRRESEFPDLVPLLVSILPRLAR